MLCTELYGTTEEGHLIFSCVQCLCTIISEISELHFEAQAGAKSMCKVNGHFLWCRSATSAFLVSCIGKPFLTRESMGNGSQTT